MICSESGGYDANPMASFVLEINGETRTVPAVASLCELLRHLGIEEGRVAVEVNHRIIRRAEWKSTPVGDRDRVEIVQFVGGG